MSEQGTTKDQVSLDDLRRAIAEYQKAKRAYESNSSLGWDIADARAEAWRTAFDWLHHGEGVARCGDAYVVGLMLIEDKLR